MIIKMLQDMCEYTLKNNLSNSRPFLLFFFQIDQTCFPSGRKHTKTNKNMDPKEIKKELKWEKIKMKILVILWYFHIGLIILGIIILELNLRYFT